MEPALGWGLLRVRLTDCALCLTATGAAVQIAASKKVAFRASKELKAAM